MPIAKTTLAAAVALAALSVPALAQEADFQLPAQCTSAAAGGMDHSAMGHGAMHGNQGGGMMGMMGMMGMDLATMPEHVQQNMRKMMITMPAMHQGMLNADADVAFACGMIAHHQGAIDMAEVLLAHGDDPQMRALAEEIIAAQVAEIGQMTEWLAANAN
ncbi:MAG: DUF305 domain-containing protein [Tabrizicola sp.]|uniref:CopM family metallochaperone n=1 Tax=Tabrizicola sp. TaxID=2005166 RepID=UPI002ABB5810|nr:DUF305 domain-containing protein [Tabrizicola sp.]